MDRNSAVALLYIYLFIYFLTCLSLELKGPNLYQHGDVPVQKSTSIKSRHVKVGELERVLHRVVTPTELGLESPCTSPRR